MAGNDVGGLLRRARDQARLSQTQLASGAGMGRNTLNAYETGRRSPTVATLDALLAACGLQARVLLEPLLADVDARVDALAGAVPELEGAAWAKLVTSLLDLPGAVTPGAGAPPARSGPVTWAIDGATALALHQLAVEQQGLEALDVAVVLDDALRWWMRAVWLKGYDRRENAVQDWLEADQERIVDALDGVRFSIAGFVRLRVVEVLPTTVRMAVPWWREPVPVVTVDEVEGSNPAYAEVLARWRHRRASPDSAVRP
ncbi:MAG TPA: helix-turn-helix transcriptional regulator [Nonomuraea sp.]|nr:helix-turn-helix transcriptional regulator [Nonomuraea sp.]